MKSDPAKQPSGSISNSESSSPTTTSSTLPLLPSSMKLTNGHLVGTLKQVSVQIERLRDIESLTPPLTPMKRSDSPLSLSSVKADILDKEKTSHTPSPKRKDIATSKKLSSKGLPHMKSKSSNTRRSLVFSSNDHDLKDIDASVCSLSKSKAYPTKDIDIDSGQMTKETNSVKTKSCLASVSKKRQLSRRSIEVGKSDVMKDEAEIGDKKPREDNQNEKCSLPSCSNQTEANDKDAQESNNKDTPQDVSSSVESSGISDSKVDFSSAGDVQLYISDKMKDEDDCQSEHSLQKEISDDHKSKQEVELCESKDNGSTPHESMNVSEYDRVSNLTDEANTVSDTDSKEYTEESVILSNQLRTDRKTSETYSQLNTDNKSSEDVNLSSNTTGIKRPLDENADDEASSNSVKREKRPTRTSPSKGRRIDSKGAKDTNNKVKILKSQHSRKKGGAIKEGMTFAQNKVKRNGIKKLRKKRKHLFTAKKVRHQKAYLVTASTEIIQSYHEMPGISPRQAGSGSGHGHKSSNQRQNTAHTPGGEGSSGYDGHYDGNNGGQQPPSGNSGNGGGNNDGNGESGGKKGDRRLKEPKIPDLKPCKVLVHKYVIRPAPVPAPPKYVKMEDGENHTLDQCAWMAVFKYLNNKELVQCLKVCKTWYRWVMHYSLWNNIDLNNTKIKQMHLIGIVKRQPQSLNLSYSNVSFRQMEWLIARLPHLKSLNMAGNSWAALSSLCSSCCPLLTSLDISWVSGVYDQCIRDLLSPPVDHRPGVNDTTSRLHHCTSLTLTGCDITDKSLACIRHNLPKIENLGLCCCTKLSDAAIETIAEIPTIKELDISKCRSLTQLAFVHLKKMPNLRKINVHACTQISEVDIVSFAQDIGGQYLHRSGLVIIDVNARQMLTEKITDNCETEMQT